MSDLFSNPGHLIVCNPDLVAVDMDGELVMLNIARGAYFGLDGVGPRVWALISHPITLEDLTTTICLEYDIDPATCRADLVALLADMHSAGVITVR